jgi:hypothetical protein
MTHAQKFRAALLLSTLLTTLSGCATQSYVALETGRLASSVDAAKSLVVGEGRYAYQFTLIDPHTAKPWPNHPYALTTGPHNHYHLPFVADPKNVYQGVSDGEGKTTLFRLPVKISDRDWDLRERFGSGPNGETFRLTAAGTGKPLSDYPYLLMICSTPPKYHIGYSYPNGDTAYSASDKPERITLSEGGSFDENDLPKSCDEPEENDDASSPKAEASHALSATAVSSDAVAPDAATDPSNGQGKALFELLKTGDEALQARAYPKAQRVFEQADAIILKHRTEFDNFAGFYGRAELQIHLATAIGDGKLGDPCPTITRSREWAAKAKLETYNDGETERRNEVDALIGRIDGEAKRLSCPTPAAIDFPKATATPEQGTPEERVIDLSIKGTESYLAKDYPNASRFFQQVQEIIDDNPSTFTSFASMMGRTNHALYMARVDGEGKLGDPCLMVAQSQSLLAQAKWLAVGQNAELWLTYVDAEKIKIDEAAAEFHCAAVKLKGKQSGK